MNIASYRLLTNRKMIRFDIFYLLALFCVSFAQPQGDPTVRCKIKEATIRNRIDSSSQTFNTGNVYFYVYVNDKAYSMTLYKIRDDSGVSSQLFGIAEHRTVVNEDGIAIVFCSMTILISALYGDNIALYRDLFSLEDFDHEFPVAKFIRGAETLENVLAVNSRENKDGEWIFAAVDSGGAPRLIFPRRYVKWTQEYEDGDKAVCFRIEHEPQGKTITVEFDRWTVAKTFYAYVDSRPNAFGSS